MSEEQRKPKSKFNLNGTKIGIAITVIVIVVILILTIDNSIESPHDYNSCVCQGGGDSAYLTCREEIRIAVAEYASRNNGAFPILNGTYSNICCQNCSVINISALSVSNGGIIKYIPESLNLSASGNDNCSGNASLGCSNEGSYVWLVNASGYVFSYCAGVECVTNNTCHQGVWP